MTAFQIRVIASQGGLPLGDFSGKEGYLWTPYPSHLLLLQFQSEVSVCAYPTPLSTLKQFII